MRRIPIEAVEVQKGLYLHTSTFYVLGKPYTRRELYSQEGYCFYDKNDKVYDEEGNETQDESKRTYMQYAHLGNLANVDDFVSVVKQDNYEVV